MFKKIVVVDYMILKIPKVWNILTNFNCFFESIKTNLYKINIRNKSNKKIVVVFIVYMPETWNSLKTVYEQCLNDDRFSPILVAHPILKDLNNPTYDFFKTKYEVMNAFTDIWLNLEQLKPDFVFYTRSYQDEYYYLYQPKNVRKYAKVCFIQYGATIDKGNIFKTVYNNNFFGNVSYIFSDNHISHNMINKKFNFLTRLNLLKVLYFGYPRFELINNSKMINKVNHKFTILWTPRFPVEANSLNTGTTFLNFYSFLLEYAKSNPSINLIIRPHPLMFEKFIGLGILSRLEVENIISEVENILNVNFDLNRDYLPAMIESDVLISDYSSLIVEYFIMNKPILYCSSYHTFTEAGELIYESMYKIKGQADMSKRLNSIRSGIDINKEIRTKNLNIFAGEIGMSPSKEILNFLLKVKKYDIEIDC